MNTSKINSMEFGILSPKLIKSLATVRIVTSDLYDADGYPVDGGVMDPRMGVVDPGLRCRTCGGTIGDCPGHFGYLELARPVIHVLYTKYIYQLLKATCSKCGKLLNRDPRSLDHVSKSPLKKCPHCGKQSKKLSFVKPYTYYSGKDELSPSSVREWFERIPDSELKKIGFDGGRPEWLVLTLFPIPPVTMRPSITLETGERSEDDLTHKLVDIVRINQSLKENIDIGAPEFILNDLWELSQYHVATYFDNELTGVPQARHRSGRPLKGIVQRLKAKEGRIRGNLLGKRVDFSSRTVISPDPTLSINEVGVPEQVSKELTIPEIITPLNIKTIKELIKDEKVNYLTRPDGRKIKVTQENKNDLVKTLTNGWSVDRQLQNNDVVLFNRQPSLHRVSVMVHKVRVMPYRTFRMNPSVCAPYNADFDGDEMNIHALQSEEARVEASMIMDVKNNIISPRFGGPLVGLDLDQISGVYILTKKETVMTKEEATQLLATAGLDMELPDKEKFTGKEIVSMMLPSELNIEFKSHACKECDKCLREKCEHDRWVSIRNGKLRTGVLDSNAVGAFKGRILNKVKRLVSEENLKNFIDSLGRLGVAYLMSRGFSIGLSDLDLPPNILKKIEREIENAQKEANGLVVKFNRGKLKALPGMTMEESLETQILSVLAEGLNVVSEIMIKHIKESDIIHMSRSGAKGSNINTTQMAAAVGSETILGKRIQRGYLNRITPHFKQGDLSPTAHGFVARGFKQGLTPFEFFWNVMNGREGLMDKSLRTRKSGYMQRRLMNSLQDLKVMEDLSIRDSNGNIVQFFVGEDGMDPTKSDWGTLNWMDHIKHG
ncbi:MAG: DNA-directed RNA polymerase subunit A' [Candidatus Aenigmarchaeota archaeon]|nr:DNA-directed RNA polymerase subunit A' [Candidatus Aenigmarchaeota archaeon]NIQ17297.1 DNA-directed RNA polymerase subunit A' [Candidatus Aenigmarchaeota archaeon]NIS73158.1 DNA-directed RNA polymerase subunit A' [Candidatus Aenigmarchaeota archaeon]